MFDSPSVSLTVSGIVSNRVAMTLSLSVAADIVLTDLILLLLRMLVRADATVIINDQRNRLPPAYVRSTIIMRRSLSSARFPRPYIGGNGPLTGSDAGVNDLPARRSLIRVIMAEFR